MMNLEKPRQWLQIIVCGLLTVTPWAFIILLSGRGLDMTDESFYLLNYRHPRDVTAVPGLFGAVISPLYYLSESIVITRILGTLILLLTVTGTTWKTLTFLHRQYEPQDVSFRQPRLVLLSLPPIAAGAIYYFTWLITPSYNWLNLVGLCLFWSGFLMWLKPNRLLEANFGAALQGGAAMIIFWAKPTSALLLPLFPLGGLLWQRANWRNLLRPQTLIFGVIGFLGVLSFPFLSGFTWLTLIERYKRSLNHRQLLLAVDNLVGKRLFKGVKECFWFLIYNPYFLILGVVVLLMWGVIFTVSKRYPKQTLIRFIASLFVLIWTINFIGLTVFTYEFPSYWGLDLFLSTFVMVWSGAYIHRKFINKHVSNPPSWLGFWSIPILSLIFIFVLGTTNDFDFQSGFAAYFYVLAVVLLLFVFGNTSTNAALTQISVPTILLAINFMVVMSSLTPYRQDESILAMKHPVFLRHEAETLVVSGELARYLTKIQSLADSADFQPDTPLIDLTASLGVAYALDARTYVHPWLIRGYSGSTAATTYVLQQWRPEQLNRAWILTVEKNGTNTLPLSILSEVGLDFPTTHTKVGTVRRPASQEIHALWKPVSN